MFKLRFVCLLLSCALFCLLLSGAEAAPRPQEEQAVSEVEADDKDLEGAASYGYGSYYTSPYLGGGHHYGGFGGYWPHYSGSYYGLGDYGYPYYSGYYGHHHHHGHYGHYY